MPVSRAEVVIDGFLHPRALSLLRRMIRTAHVMVRAATLPVTSESTHRLPLCSSCLFTLSIHSNNAYSLNISRWIPHPLIHTPIKHLSRTLTTPQHNAIRHDTTRHDVTAASLPYLSYPRHLTTLLITHPHPYHPHPKPSTPHISHPHLKPPHHARRQHASAQATGSAARYVRQRQGSGVALAVRRSAAARQPCIKGLWRGRRSRR
jgi:hypothetical protein